VPPDAPVDPVDPVEPVAPVAPAGPGTAITAAGVTTVGLSHALNATAVSTAENTIAYFMRIPFDCLTKNRSPGQKCGHPELQFQITPYRDAFPFAGAHNGRRCSPGQAGDCPISAQIRKYVQKLLLYC
jgi:hypothetical protein